VATYTVPTGAPEGDGTLAWDSTTMVLLRVEAGGHTGLGWTYGPGACAAVVDGLFRDLVLGSDPLDVVGTNTALQHALRNAGRPGVCAMALSAVDVALWDLKARILDLPLHKLLGAVRAQVPVYGSGGFTTYDETQLADQLGGWVEAGIPRVKLKIGEAWGRRTDRDVQRVAQARRVVGDDVDLFVDANGAYGVGQARRVAARVADHDVVWFEEPVSSDDLAGLAAVPAAATPNLRHLEYFHDHVRIEGMLFDGTLDASGGVLVPRDEPGLGLRLRETDAEPFRVG
jgi:L-alanine-DL-glutamate epimerase-like enolase superfamily enzyme